MPDLLAQQLPSLFGPGRRTAWRRRVARRLVAALLLCLGLALALGEHAAGPTRSVLVARAAVPAGEPVGADAVRVEERTAGELPHDALTTVDEAAGLLSTVDISPGEVLTGQRVLGRSAEADGPGTRLVTLPLVGAPVSVSVGDRVDVHRPGSATPVATDARVVAVPASPEGLAATEPTVVLALPRESAAEIVESIGAGEALGFLLTTRVRADS